MKAECVIVLGKQFLRLPGPCPATSVWILYWLECALVFSASCFLSRRKAWGSVGDSIRASLHTSMCECECVFLKHLSRCLPLGDLTIGGLSQFLEVLLSDHYHCHSLLRHPEQKVRKAKLKQALYYTLGCASG